MIYVLTWWEFVRRGKPENNIYDNPKMWPNY